MHVVRLPSFLRSLIAPPAAVRLRFWFCALCGLCGLSGIATADDAVGIALDATVAQSVRQLLLARLTPDAAAHADVQIGRLDARLRLAPCDRVQPHVADGVRVGGALRVGLRCEAGSTHWNVYVPVLVKVAGRALVAAGPLAAGTVLAAGQLVEAGTDLADDPTPTYVGSGDALLGRVLAQPLAAGQALHASHLRPRVWFAVGDVVQVRARGDGFSIDGEGLAMTTGIDGQPARVRTESGRVLTGVASARHQIDVSL